MIELHHPSILQNVIFHYECSYCRLWGLGVNLRAAPLSRSHLTFVYWFVWSFVVVDGCGLPQGRFIFVCSVVEVFYACDYQACRMSTGKQ